MKIQAFERINGYGIQLLGEDETPEHQYVYNVIELPKQKKQLSREEYLRELQVSISSCNSDEEEIDWNEDIESLMEDLN